MPTGAGFGFGLNTAFEESWEGVVNLEELVALEDAIALTLSRVLSEGLLDSRTLTAEETWDRPIAVIVTTASTNSHFKKVFIRSNPNVERANCHLRSF